MARQTTIKKSLAQAEPLSGVTKDSAVRKAGQQSRLARSVPHAVALLVFSLVTVGATWPMLPNLGGYVVSKLDPLYSVWAMAWQAHALATDPLGLFDTNIMYPFKGTLAFDELSFAQAVISAPLYWLSGNPVLSHNAQILLTFVLSGYGMWLLVRELTGSGPAGAVAGMAFAFSFYRFNHLPHITLLSTQWLPFVLLAAYKLLWTKSWRWAWALGGFFVLQALSSHYLAFYSVILLGLFALFYAPAQRKGFSLAFLGKAGVAMAVALLLMLPVIVPYVAVQSGHKFTRGLFEVERYSNTLSSFLAVYQSNPHQGNPLYRAILAPFSDPGPWPWERAAFPGFVVLALSLVALLFRNGPNGQTTDDRRQTTDDRRQTAAILSSVVRRPSSAVRRPEAQTGLGRHVLFFVVLALLTALLSLGPTLQLSYAPSSYDPNAINGVLPLPYVLLHEWVPGFQSMRVVARITVLTVLALSALAGIGAFYLLGWVLGSPLWGEGRRQKAEGRRQEAEGRGQKAEGSGQKAEGSDQLPLAVLGFLPSIRGLRLAAYCVLLSAFCLLPVAESWSAPVHLEPVGTRQAVPPVYRWLAQQPRTVALEYPMVSYKRGESNVEMANAYQYYSAYHWQPLVNGSTTIRPTSYSALVRETEDCFPCPRSLDALWALGVEYVVAHLENLSGPQRTDFLWRSTDPAGKVSDDFILVQDFGSDRVYRLKNPRKVGELAQILPEGASLLLGDPALDPIKLGNDKTFIGGGYMAALSYYLRDHAQYGDPKLGFGQAILPSDPSNPPDYALLWAGQDPLTAGYLAENRVWANEHVTLYKRGPSKAYTRHTP